jgi:hypothetical protein
MEKAIMGEAVLCVPYHPPMDSTDVQKTQIITPIKKPSSNTSNEIPDSNPMTSGL